MNELDKDLLLAANRSSFPNFIRKSFDTVSPNAQYIHNWSIDCISEYLMACERREIKRLIINIPPRHLKSIICSVAFPAWLLGRNPSTQVLCASYTANLSMVLSMQCRLVTEMPWYRAMYPSMKIAADQNTKSHFQTTQRGLRYAAGAGGTITGFGGDFLIIDDPLNATEQASKTKREGINTWHDGVWSSRLNDRKEGVMILIMQRLHMDDLTGHLLDQGGWEHLKIPLVCEETTTYSMGSFHKEYKEGDLLHEERIGPTEIEDIKRQSGPYAFSGQYQQRPSPEGGEDSEEIGSNITIRSIRRLSMSI